MAQHSSLIFITGGVRSGKSTFAEEVAIDLRRITGGSLYYLAAGQSPDGEMDERVAQHRATRLESGQPWKTIEKPTNVGELSIKFERNDVVLLDCLTTWLNNEFFYSENWQDKEFQRSLFQRMTEEIDCLRNVVHTLVIVSNEVQFEAITEKSLVLPYCRLLGYLHQFIVSTATEAYAVESGIPLVMKGERK